MGHQRAKNQKNGGRFGVQKMGPGPKSGIFLANVGDGPGIIFSLLGNYLGPLKIKFPFFYLFKTPDKPALLAIMLISYSWRHHKLTLAKTHTSHSSNMKCMRIGECLVSGCA